VKEWRLSAESEGDEMGGNANDSANPPRWSAEEHAILSSLGARVRGARKARGLSIAAAAAATGLDASYLGELERGRRNASILTLARLAKALGTRVENLTAATRVE
jgi:ribosome-binding protein aMBF1 (putative translation factor)